MMVETQSTGSASPTGLALHHSGEEIDMDLKAQRAELAKAEYSSYDPENFPGSKGWLKNKQAQRALDAFDAAHPEILAANKAAREQKEEVAYEAMSDFVKGGS